MLSSTISSSAGPTKNAAMPPSVCMRRANQPFTPVCAAGSTPSAERIFAKESLHLASPGSTPPGEASIYF